MQIELDESGHIKYSYAYKTLLSNGYQLSLWFGKMQDDEWEGREYWITVEGIEMAHKCFARYIKDFGAPRTGDEIDDGIDTYCVHKIYFNYAEDTPEIEILLT